MNWSSLSFFLSKPMCFLLHCFITSQLKSKFRNEYSNLHKTILLPLLFALCILEYDPYAQSNNIHIFILSMNVSDLLGTKGKELRSFLQKGNMRSNDTFLVQDDILGSNIKNGMSILLKKVPWLVDWPCLAGSSQICNIWNLVTYVSKL